MLDHLVDTLLAFLLEEEIAHRKHLVDDKQIGLGDGSDGEGNACDHA